MSNQLAFDNAKALYNYIESKNSHGKLHLLNELVKLGFAKSSIFKTIETDGRTNFGKNILKDIWLRAFITKMA